MWVAGVGGRMAFVFAATHGAGPAIGRFSIAHHITGSGAWVAALVMMALADVLTRLAVVWLRGRRLAAARPPPRRSSRPAPMPDLVSGPAAGPAVSRKARPAAAGLMHGTTRPGPAPAAAGADRRPVPGRAGGAGVTGVPGTIRILIADDQRVVRDGLSMLVGLIDGVEVVGTACDGAEAVRLAEAYHPDVVLMDLRMPGTDGITATADLRERLPATRVLVLTTYASQDAILPALQAGARGYLTKDASAEQIEDAIHAVHADQARGRTDIGTVSGASAAPLGSLTPMVVPLSFDPESLQERQREAIERRNAQASQVLLALKVTGKGRKAARRSRRT